MNSWKRNIEYIMYNIKVRPLIAAELQHNRLMRADQILYKKECDTERGASATFEGAGVEMGR